MLTTFYVGLRFVHFAALISVLGCALYGGWWAPAALRRLFTQRFSQLIHSSLLVGTVSAVLMMMVQGGLMGDGWGDVWQPDVWLAVATTQFGSVWIWQIVLAGVALVVGWVKPRQMMRLLLLLTAAQFILLAGTGHSAMRDGIMGAIQRSNHALHLLFAASWLGGLPPFLYCLRLAKGRWRQAAIYTMMRFSRYGHVAVAGVVLTGVINALLIQNGWPLDTAYSRMLLIKCALVAVMVVIALVNRYVVVPRMAQSTTQRFFLRATQMELVLGALVLASVSLFATWEPF
ncbi:copper homeostasis membrane protein CopD [Pseudocitrobacter cyperus]|uniref:Copper resistance protein D n=1 Tax=Pseudocitrobacter cyperus TaxID=3112843 RepID=A0ABV0HEE8_9ENTR